MSNLRLVDPLPECGMCERPTARTTFERTGGLCSECDEGIREAAGRVARGLRPIGETWYDQ